MAHTSAVNSVMSACLAAVAACRVRSDDLHPVHARNIGLYPAWERWAAQEAGAGQFGVGDVLARMHLRFSANDNQVRDILLRHLAFDRQADRDCSLDVVEGNAMFATAALMFWQRMNVVVELTSALERLLTDSDLGEDIPAAQLRPRMAACYIRFGEAMRHAVVLPAASRIPENHIEGAYVFESEHKGKRAVSIVAIYAAGRDQPLGISSLDFVIDDEQEALVGVIRRQCGGSAGSASILAQQEALAQLCAKVFLYWDMEQAHQVTLTPHRDLSLRLRGMGPRKAAKLLRQTARLYDRVVLGPSSPPCHLCAGSDGMAPHWRRGHFRMQAHGPRMSLRKVILIAPTVVRADRLTDDGFT